MSTGGADPRDEIVSFLDDARGAGGLPVYGGVEVTAFGPVFRRGHRR